MSKRTYQTGAAKRRKIIDDRKFIATLPKLTSYFTIPLKSGGESENQSINEGGNPSTLSEHLSEIMPQSESEKRETAEGNDVPQVISQTTSKPVSSDPANWIQFTEEERIFWINKGPEFFQNRNSNFNNSARRYTESNGKVKTRHLNKSAFFRKLRNGETVDRSWLIYSPSKKVLYCFSCRLFATTSNAFSSENGFNDWKHSNVCISEHENTLGHRQATMIYLSRKKNAGLLMDKVLTDQMNNQINYWKEVLRRIVEVIKFLASRGLAFRKDDQTIGSQHNGNYLGTLELLSKFDPFLAEHIKNYGNKGKGFTSYLSASICNEFISIMGYKVLSKIIAELKKAKYFSVSVDSTPDISHVDQLTFVIRYVNDGIPVERFLDFIPIESHKSEYLSDTIVSFINDKGINISDCRGQTYDNAPNMAGKYSGLQARLKEKCPTAIFVPCLAHSLNLVGAQAAGCVLEVIDYFQLLQKLYSFFSSSTHRWNTLTECLGSGLVVKRPSDTRWSAHSDAVTALQKSYERIMAVLQTFEENKDELPETRLDARGLLKKLKKFENIVLTEFWGDVLSRINQTSISIQKKDLPLDDGLKLIESLIAFVCEQREKFSIYETIAKKNFPDSKYKDETTRTPQRSSRLKFYDGEARDVILQGSERFKVEVYLPVIDTLISQLKSRSTAYKQITDLFGFFSNLNSLTTKELMIHCNNLCRFYTDDLNEKELVLELEHFKHYLAQEKKLGQLGINDMYEIVKNNNLEDTFPNIDISFRIFLSLMITNCSSERSFSRLKLIKNELRNSMTQERLSHLSIMSIENDVLQKIDFDDVIEDFASQKARKVLLT
ncbi:zinc finger MYM-type protein 1-like [Parasteatoda tepidariorum]|uniref:zinc finger MYM-type protein 1-like n=1 Tax=Parasteatoda tepidariorum TaxID=114398 RepID=UPI00077F88A0